MTSLLRALGQRLREYLFLIVSFPISVILYSLVIFGLGSGGFLPVAVLIFLFLLTVMERVARFEIWRTNKILRTEIGVVPNWFSQPFFSWAGVKERITSLRSWMVIAYIFAIFGLSIFAFVLLSFGVAGLFAIAMASGAVVLSSIDKSFDLSDKGDEFFGSFKFFGSSGEIRLDFGDKVDRGYFNYNVESWWTVALGLILILLALWLIPRVVRTMVELVEGLPGGGYYSSIESKIINLQKRRGIKKDAVRSAIADEVARPELANLSKREREILALMAEGKSNSGIAKALYITEGSVEKHISSILNKLGLTVESESHRRVLAVLTYLGLNNHKSD